MELLKTLLRALRCPCLWYCARFGRMDCAACQRWQEGGERHERHESGE